jgi:hypothetical protein
LYSSFTVQFTGLPSNNGTYIAHFKDDPTFAYPARVIAATTNAAPGTLRLSIGNGTTWSADQGQYPLDLSTGTVYTVVTKLEVSSGQATMWIDPTLETDLSVTGSDTLTPADIVQYAFRQASGGGICFVDNLKVGTSFNDVAGPNSPPSITAVSDQSIGANSSTGPLAFTVTDTDTPAGSLTVTAASDNTALVPNLIANLALGGAGENRTVTVTPLAGQQGSTTITLTVDDGELTNSTQFAVNVGYPSISAIANQVTPSNTFLGPLAFTVTDTETAAGSLTVTATSTDEALIPVSNINIANLGGSSRTVTVTPVASSVGSSDITLTVDDGTLTASTTFNVTVYPQIGVILREDFNYADGSLTAVSFGLWESHSGTNTESVSVSNSEVLLSGALSEDVNAVLNQGSVFPPFEGSGAYVLYSSFIVNFSGFPSSSGAYFAHYKDLSTGFRARVMAATEGATPGYFRMGIQSSGSPTEWFPRDLALGVPYVIATRFNTVTSDALLWVNPVSELDQSVSAFSTFPGVPLYQYAFRQAGGIGDLVLDNLVVGTSFSDIAVAVSPEALEYEIIGSDLILSWTSPLLVLQSAAQVNGPYFDVPVASSPYTNALSGDQKFFRLKY